MIVQKKQRRGGFTLVELLIGIAVIGILAGMLSYALIPALNRGKEFAIQQEMSQIESAIEQFKTKYGFYPPSFVRVRNYDPDSNGTSTLVEQADFILAFLNRIAPNHAEDEIVTGTTRRIDLWYTSVGQFIEHDDGDDLVFLAVRIAQQSALPVEQWCVNGGSDATRL